MTTRALVTGASGFVAQWTIREMMERGWEVHAGAHGDEMLMPVLTPSERDAVRYRPLDVTSQPDVAAAVDAAEPDVVIHLAAVSHVPDAMRNPGYAYEVNALGTVHLLTEIRRHRQAGTSDPTVLIVGSAEQYGRHALDDMPLSENAEQRPLSLYAASKCAQEVAALQAWRSDGVRVICTRSFNHSGVGHAAHFLLPALVRRAVALPAAGGTLEIGNGDTVRDFLHVRDVVTAYLALVQDGVAGEVYNVCSGIGLSVRALAARVLERTGRSASLQTSRDLARPVDVPVQIGNPNKLRQTTGWTPRLTVDDIIDDLIHAATH